MHRRLTREAGVKKVCQVIRKVGRCLSGGERVGGEGEGMAVGGGDEGVERKRGEGMRKRRRKEVRQVSDAR